MIGSLFTPDQAETAWMSFVIILVAGGVAILSAVYQRTRSWKWYERLGIFTVYPVNVFFLASPSFIDVAAVGLCLLLIWVASGGKKGDFALAVAGVPMALFGIALGLFRFGTETGLL